MSAPNPAPVYAVFRQSLTDAWANGRGSIMPLAIFSAAIFLLALNWPKAAGSAKAFVPAVFLVLTLLIALMQTERIFQEDFEDGSLALWANSDMPLSTLAATKVLCHWAIGMLPLSVFMPVLAIPFGWTGFNALIFCPVMAVFGLGVYCLGGVVGALTIATKRNAALIALLILPLTLPLCVYASAFLLGGDMLIFAMLASAGLFIMSTTPFLMAASLRMALG